MKAKNLTSARLALSSIQTEGDLLTQQKWINAANHLERLLGEFGNWLNKSQSKPQQP